MNIIKNFDIIAEQNGGSERFYAYDEEESFDEDTLTAEDFSKKKVVECHMKNRSYVLADINEEIYNKILSKIEFLRYGDKNNTNTLEGGLKVSVYKPGEQIDFERELLVTEDYLYPKLTECYSTIYTCDILEENGSDAACDDTYRLFGIDMIWCRKDTLGERLVELLSSKQ